MKAKLLPLIVANVEESGSCDLEKACKVPRRAGDHSVSCIACSRVRVSSGERRVRSAFLHGWASLQARGKVLSGASWPPETRVLWWIFTLRGFLFLYPHTPFFLVGERGGGGGEIAARSGCLNRLACSWQLLEQLVSPEERGDLFRNMKLFLCVECDRSAPHWPPPLHTSGFSFFSTSSPWRLG